MTGRGLGYCSGHPAPGYAAGGYGRGAGLGWHGGGGYGGGGRGAGRGFRHRYYATGVPGLGRGAYVPTYGPPGGYVPPAPYSAADEAAALKANAEYLAAALEETKSRLSDLESDEDK